MPGPVANLHEFDLLRRDSQPRVLQDVSGWHLKQKRRLLKVLLRLDSGRRPDSSLRVRRAVLAC